MRPEADRLLGLHGVELSPDREDSPQHRKTCEALAKAHITFYRLQDRHDEGDFSACDDAIRSLETALLSPKKTTTPEEPSAESGIMLVEAFEEMYREKSLDGSWKPKVAAMERQKFALFQAVIDPDGILPVQAVRAKHLTRYKAVLHLMPAGKGKKKEYRDLAIPDLLHIVEAGNIPAELRMETNTIRTYCQSAAAFINWAARHEYHDRPGITQLLQVKADRQAHEFRDPYSDGEISKLFAPEFFLTGGGRGKADSGGKPSRFWVPLLGLFTGARIEELAQLHTDDIVLVNHQEDARRVFTPGQPVMDAAAVREAEEAGETLCLFINTGKPYQRLKNVSSRRYVPLSPVPEHDLGFLNYAASVFQNAEQARVDKRTVPGDGRLFPELTRIKEADNFAHSLSKWFSPYRAKAGVVPQEGGGKKDFHSFRHTVARWCDQNEVPEKIAARYLGHSHDTMTYGRYSPEATAHRLYQHIAAGFGEYLRSLLDIEGLKAGRWSGGKP